ncbi:MAG: ATP-binding protein [Blautia sp.]
MIKSFIYENFKSFERAELNLEAVTSLIGSNSSGKSNAIEGIQILAEAATGMELSVILDGTRSNESHVRGGSSACCRFKTSAFTLGCLVDIDEKYDLYYYIRISTGKQVWIEEEALYKVPNGVTSTSDGEMIFKTRAAAGQNSDIIAEYNKKTGKNPEIMCMRVSSILAQLKVKLPQKSKRDRECLEYITLVLENLKGIFVLNPIPKAMRDYVRITDTQIKENGENISPVLYELCKDDKKEEVLLDVICSLPENEVGGIEFIKTQLNDVIFGLKEHYAGTTEIVDAKRLSDGTLRCIAIVAAILSIPENGILVVEEIDNGIHPRRVNVLIDRLSQLGELRNIDIILTTHNPVLLNKYDKDKLLGVSVVYRDKEKGVSKFIPFVEIEQYPKLLAKGGLGEAMLDDSLIKMIKNPSKLADYAWLEV